MIWDDFHLYVRQEGDKLDSSAFADIQPEQIDLVAKKIINQYVRDRYTQYEEDQLAIDDLRNSIVRQTLNALEVAENLSVYTFDIYEGLPPSTKVDDSNYMFLLKGKTESKVKYCGVQYGALINDKFNTTALKQSVYKQVKLNDINKLLEDPFNSPTIERPLLTYEAGVGTGTGRINVYTDGTFTVKKLTIDYLSKPIVPTIATPNAILSLPSDIHYHLVDLVAKDIYRQIEQYDAYSVEDKEIKEKSY